MYSSQEFDLYMWEIQGGVWLQKRAFMAEKFYMRMWFKLAIFVRLPFLLEQYSPSIIDRNLANSSHRV